MDIEGNELRVLRGARGWFEAGHRPTILYEANGFTLAWGQHSPTELNAAIDSLGYYRYEMGDAGERRMPARFEPRCLVDYLASPVPLEALPARNWWAIFKRTVRAYQHGSAEARAYTTRHLLERLRLVWTVTFA